MKRYSVVSTSSSPGSFLQVRNSDIVKRGCLYVKRPPSSNPVKLRLKTWQKRYLVLRDMCTQDGDTVLELYNSENAAATSSVGVPHEPNNIRHCSINLRNIIYVDVYTDSRSFPFAFTVLRSAKSPLIFGAKTDLEMREWMMAIKLLADKVAHLQPTDQQMTVDGNGTLGRTTNDVRFPPPRVETRSTLSRDNQIHRSTPQLLDGRGLSSSPKVRANKGFRHSPVDLNAQKNIPVPVPAENSKFLVRVQRTDDSALHQLNGEYYMVVSDSEIYLRKSTTNDAVIAWPIQLIRKLKSEATSDGLGDLITLVAHSQCGKSQGTYTFRLTSGVDLIRRVRMLVKKLETVDNSCQRQQRDIAKLNHAASSSLDKKLSTSLLETASIGGQSVQSLVLSSGSSSGSQIDQQDDNYTFSSSGQSHMYFSTGNSYLPIVDTSSHDRPPSNSLAEKKMMTLSRSMGSLGFLSTTSRQVDSGFESSEDVVALNSHPPVPPPRPVHTIGIS